MSSEAEQKPGSPASAEGDKDAEGEASGANLTRRERLAAAAAKRREQRAKERAQAAAIGLDASERVDDVLSRTSDKTVRFVRRHFNVMQWLIVASIAGWVGFQVYAYRKEKQQAKLGDALINGVEAVQAPLMPEPDPELPVDESKPTFASDDERLQKARAAFEAAVALGKDKPAAALAELGLAGVELDLGKHAEARSTYERVKARPAVDKLPEIRGRALEGIALSHEAAGDREAALKAYRELENANIEGFVELALLSQARLLNEDGKTAEAKQVLEKLSKQLEKAQLKPDTTFYLGPTLQMVRQAVDPEGETRASTEEPDMEALRKAFEEMGQGKPLTVPAGVPPGGAPAPLELPLAPDEAAPAPAPAPAPQGATAGEPAPSPAPPAAPAPADDYAAPSEEAPGE